MLFIVRFEDVYAEQPHRLPKRAAHMDAHLAFLAGSSAQIAAAGALRTSQDGSPVGGVWIVEAEDEAAAESLYRADPFWTAGLRKSVCVSHWATAYWSPPFTSCMESFRQSAVQEHA